MSGPTPSQALLLFGLLARHGESRQGDLMPAVIKADREILVRAKLIEVEKQGRSLNIKLADAGWAWTDANLSVALPPAQRSLSDLLRRLGEHLAATGETLADFIGSKPVSPPSQTAAVKPKKATNRSKATKNQIGKAKARKSAVVGSAGGKPPSAAALRKRIEAAYLAITGDRKNESVRLSRLRSELSDLDRPTVDAALARILKADKKASLMRHDDPRQLDQADRDAAFNPAGDPFHVIWIAS